MENLKDKIKQALINKGCSVIDSQNNLYDFIVSFFDELNPNTVLMIVVNGKSLTKEQNSFIRTWRGHIVIAKDILGALDAVGKLEH